MINTPFDETTGDITPDGLYMTFGSNKDLYWVSTGFIDSLMLTNFLPYVMNTIPNQVARKGEQFNFTIPDSTFIDDDGNSTLHFHALQSNGNPLPGWLAFDTITGTFSGIPDQLQTISIRASAVDTAGAAVSATFTINVQNPVSTWENHGKNKSIRIYPNPAREFINIQMEMDKEAKGMAEIWDQVGRLRHKFTFSGNIRMDVTVLKPGLYLIRLCVNDTVSVHKIYIQ